MTRQKVTLIREVRYTNHDGSFGGAVTEAIDAVVEWPEATPDATLSEYICQGDWRIVSRIDPEVGPNA